MTAPAQATPATPSSPRGDRLRSSLARLRDDRWAEWFAAALLLLASFVAISALIPPLRRYFAQPDDVVSMLTFPIVPNFVYAALLFSTGVALRRRLRAAWWFAFLWLLALPEVDRIIKLIDGQWNPWRVIGTVLVAFLIAVAVSVRHQFSARIARRNLLAALALFAVGVLATILVAGVLIPRHTSSAEPGVQFSWVFSEIVGDLGGVGEQIILQVPWWVRAVVGLMGAATVLGSAYVLFRAPRFTRELEAADDARVRTMLREFGDDDSLGYFATRRDKAVVWDADDRDAARAGVSYRVFGSVCLASGNPVGDPARWPQAIERWRELSRANGWSLAVMGAGEAAAEAYDAAGLVAWEIGDEAIVDLAEFSLNGPGMKPVRQAVSRLQRRGYVTDITRHSELTAEQFAELEAAAEHWRGDGGDERGFSMALGRMADPLDGDCLLVSTRDTEGHLRGFLSFVPWGRNGLSLDLMRRDPTADNGLVELMVSTLGERAAKLGLSRVSLNFAMFREAFERGEEVGAGPLARLWRQGLLIASRSWQLESLYRSNAKYLPDWQPRFVCFEYSSDLLRVGIAAGNAEGFLSRPSLSRLIRRGTDAGEMLARSDADYAAAVTAAMPPPRDELAAAMATVRQPEQVRVRMAKLDRLRAAAIDPYPPGYQRTHTLAEVRAQAGDLPPTRRGEPWSRSPAGCCSSGRSASSLSRRCATGPAICR